jgi:hypothetical protein
MKKVYSSTKELSHVWAQGGFEPYLRANSTSTSYGRFYSYSTCIAELHTNGTHVVLNTHSYSSTTCKHQHHVRNAIHSLTVISLDMPNYNLPSLLLGQEDFDHLILPHNLNKITTLVNRASKARKNGDAYMREAQDILFNLQAYAQLQNLTFNADNLGVEAIASNVLSLKKESDATRKALEDEKLIEWRSGANTQLNFAVTALRITGDEVITTKGARVPLQSAIDAYPLLVRLADDKTGNLFNRLKTSGKDINFGHYTVNNVTSKLLTVGCHTIPMSEVHALAKQLGITS